MQVWVQEGEKKKEKCYIKEKNKDAHGVAGIEVMEA